MKKFKYLLPVVIFVLCILSTCAFAAEYATDDVTISMQINNPAMQVNGVFKEIDPGNGTTPVIVDDRTLVPIRAIIESLNGTVGWNEVSKTVTLNMEDDSIRLVIDSNLAYLNDKKHTLDVAPAIINNRTMLPIRFIAEGFDLGVAWNSETKTVTLIKQEFSLDEYELIMSQVPTYSGKPYTEVNSNVPLFKQYEFIDASFEHYNDVDYLGRCGVCIASVSKELMPTEERGSISSVKPTGWQSVTYENVNGSYLYNRCHLIGFQLTGENANRENLITGTRYLNINGMLDFENDVAEYVKNTGNHVMYRVTPVFISSNLVADGLLMEGYSVEDNGAGISFCVYCYNVQPGIEINYADGTSKRNESYNQAVNTENNTVTAVFILNTNTKKFHCESCSSADDIKPENREISHSAASELVNAGYSACKICNPK